MFSRPATSFPWFLSPWSTFKHIVWKHYKWHIIAVLAIILLVLWIVLLVYTFPQNLSMFVVQMIKA
jgi:hypothetical protein